MKIKFLQDIGIITNINGVVYVGSYDKALNKLKQREELKEKDYFTDELNEYKAGMVWDAELIGLNENDVNILIKSKQIKKV